MVAFQTLLRVIALFIPRKYLPSSTSRPVAAEVASAGTPPAASLASVARGSADPFLGISDGLEGLSDGASEEVESSSGTASTKLLRGPEIVHFESWRLFGAWRLGATDADDPLLDRGSTSDADLLEDHHHKKLKQKVILIRHGEKPADGDDLSDRGRKRAECLSKHFKDTGITNLWAFDDKKSKRPVETLQPLSRSLGLNIDTSVKRDDVDELAKVLGTLPGDSVSLVCWEHSVLPEIAEAIGVDHAPAYPGSEFDWQWTIVDGDLEQENEQC